MTDTKEAMGIIKKAIHDDPDYAWGWLCNLAMASLDEGLSHRASNQAAARFMSWCFKIDMTKHELYAYGEKDFT